MKFSIIRNAFLLITFLAFGYSAHAQLEEGLLIHYKLDGTFLDESENAFHGEGFNEEFVDDYLGNPNSAMEANGDNTYVEFPNVPELEVGFPLTMAVRAKFDVLDNGQQVILATDFAETTHSGAWLQVNSQGNLSASFGDASGGFNSISRHGKIADFNLEIDTWYSIVTVIRGFNDIDIYIDCELIEGDYGGSATSIGYTSASGSLCRKRANLDIVLPPHYFDGSVDEFYYWNRDLDAEEILAVCCNTGSNDNLISSPCDSLTTGISDFSGLAEAKFGIYPNPSSDGAIDISFESPKSGQATIDIFDSYGRKVNRVMNSPVGSNQAFKIKFDTSGLARGVYYIKLQVGNEFITRKLLVTD